MGSLLGVWPWTGWEEYGQGRIYSSEQHSTQRISYSKVDLKMFNPECILRVFLHLFHVYCVIMYIYCIPLSVFRTVERSNFKPIVHISALTKSESGNIHLVAITKTGTFFWSISSDWFVTFKVGQKIPYFMKWNSLVPSIIFFSFHFAIGVRLYFTTNPFGNNKGRPCMLTLVHVRLPPGFSASTTVHKPQNVHMAYHKKGIVIMKYIIVDTK